MPTYKIAFDLVHNRGNRTFELEPKTEVIIERNLPYAKLHLLNKYFKAGRTEIKWKEIECVLTHFPGGELQ